MRNPKCRKRNSTLIGLVVLLTATVPAAESNVENRPAPSLNMHQWGAVTLFHGLPSNHVRAITQDVDGTMWFGTDSGLARNDGRRIQKVAAEGPASGRVLALKLDLDGTLWIGADTGAARLAGGNISSVAQTEGKAVTAIVTPERGRAVMASEQGTIFDCSTMTDGSLSVRAVEPRDHPPLSIDPSRNVPLPLASLAMDGEALIVGTRSRGLLSVQGGEVKQIPSQPRAFFVEAIERDPAGRLWFGAQNKREDGGLYESADMLRPRKMTGETGSVTALSFDSRGGVWFGTQDRGLFHYRETGADMGPAVLRGLERFTFENTAGGLRSNHVYTIFIDREAVVWVGTDRGVCRYDPLSPHVEALGETPPSGFARALFQSADGDLWCGTNSGLFVRPDPDAGWSEARELTGRMVHAIAEDSQGRLLVGTAGGLYAGMKSSGTSNGSRRFTRIEIESAGPSPSDSVRAICEFRGATYIASFGRGVERLVEGRRTVVWPSESAGARERQVVALHAFRDEKLWISTAEAGLFTFDGKESAPGPLFDKLRANTVWTIEQAGDEATWLGTSRGLYVLRPGALQAVLEGYDVRGITVSVTDAQESAWVATVGGGLFRVLMDDRGEALVSRMTAEQGLPSESALAVLSTRARTNEEVLWIGTSRGVARYEPGRIAPGLRATRIMGRRVYSAEEMRSGLDLEYPQNSLALEVGATSSRTFPEQFQYSFALYDGGGKVVLQKLSHDSQLLMEDLRPGRYRIEARAYSNDLVQSEPLAFDFRVASAPFPWTSAALSFLLVLALAAVWWGSRQNRRLATSNEALGGANREIADTRLQLANETETERRRIARDLHDQTLADLRSLLLLTDQLPTGQTDNGRRLLDPSVFRSEVESISTEIRRICEDLSPSVLANIGLAAALEWALADASGRLPPERKFDYEFACDEGLEEKLGFDPGVQIQIYRIVQEAVSNICRHSGATRVRLEVKVDEDETFNLRLEDNGRGFDCEAGSSGTGRGLVNIRTRASLLEAEAIWSRRPEGGTVFTMSGPRAARQEVRAG
jgi:signal transduction histidine kinase/ligand-binding sensor domain-containing protein